MLIVTLDEQRDTTERIASTMRTTAGELEGVSDVLYRSAKMSPDENTRRRLQVLGDAVAAEAAKIRARIAHLGGQAGATKTDEP